MTNNTPDIWHSFDEECTVIDVDALLIWLECERDKWPERAPRHQTLDWVVRALRAKRNQKRVET